MFGFKYYKQNALAKQTHFCSKFYLIYSLFSKTFFFIFASQNG